jgi:hypothetical protein
MTPTSNINRLSEDVFITPASFVPSIERTNVHIKLFCPSRHVLTSSIESKHPRIGVMPSIIRLFLRGGPLAVIWSVVFIVVDSIYRVTIWSFAHIPNKLPKIIPFRADINASASIILVRRTVKIIDSFAHSHPSCVKGMGFAYTLFRHVALQIGQMISESGALSRPLFMYPTMRHC